MTPAMTRVFPLREKYATRTRLLPCTFTVPVAADVKETFASVSPASAVINILRLGACSIIHSYCLRAPAAAPFQLALLHHFRHVHAEPVPVGVAALPSGRPACWLAYVIAVVVQHPAWQLMHQPLPARGFASQGYRGRKCRRTDAF